jgi:hypothetical protein
VSKAGIRMLLGVAGGAAAGDQHGPVDLTGCQASAIQP